MRTPSTVSAGKAPPGMYERMTMNEKMDETWSQNTVNEYYTGEALREFHPTSG